MKMIFILLSLVLFSSTVWSQGYSEVDQYPETDPATLDGGEFSHPRGLPSTDYEDVPREEQEYVPDQEFSADEMAPEEIYEADEEYLE